MIGEPLDPRLREWLRDLVGPDAVLADGWGQMELGGIVSYDLTGPNGLPAPGVALVDETGHEVRDGDPGEWVLRYPWAGTMRSVEHQGEDPTAYHWERYPGLYATGDRARRRPDGTVEFLGRYDQVISISGQLVSLTEVEQALLEHPFVNAAVAFELVDTRLGRSVGAAIALEPGTPDDDVTLREMQDSVRELLGGLSRPRTLVLLDRLDPERTGPLLDEVLAKAASGTATAVRMPWSAVADALARREA
jgi:acetyl-CoA synthetase